jgi:hypothetical protein
MRFDEDSEREKESEREIDREREREKERVRARERVSEWGWNRFGRGGVQATLNSLALWEPHTQDVGDTLGAKLPYGRQYRRDITE